MINLKAEFVEIGNMELGEMDWTYNCYEVEIEICNVDNINDVWEEERNIRKRITHELGFDTTDLFLIKTRSEYYLLKTFANDHIHSESSADSVYDILGNGDEEQEISLKSDVSIDDAIKWLKSLPVVTVSDVEEDEKLNKYYWDESRE